MTTWTEAKTLPPSELHHNVGETFVSHWFVVDQERIDAFAKVTEDEQFIHVDPVEASATPFGGTVAHGFLTLSLLSPMAYSTLPKVKGAAMGINYGFDRVRFLHPVVGQPRARPLPADRGAEALGARMATPLRRQRRDRRPAQAGAGGDVADDASGRVSGPGPERLERVDCVLP